jgi:O-6-methylguanine DNA methyltransferase
MKLLSQKSPKILRTAISTPITGLTLFAEKNTLGIVVISVSFGVNKQCYGFRTQRSNDPILLKYAKILRDFLAGKVRSLDTIPIDFSWCTPFQKDVLKAARSIQWGSVITYSDLAAKAGHPSAVRAAAAVMRNNRFPLIVPCHRVVARGGRIGGFMGATNGASVVLKKKLLTLEGLDLFLR